MNTERTYSATKTGCEELILSLYSLNLCNLRSTN